MLVFRDFLGPVVPFDVGRGRRVLTQASKNLSVFIRCLKGRYLGEGFGDPFQSSSGQPSYGLCLGRPLKNETCCCLRSFNSDECSKSYFFVTTRVLGVGPSASFIRLLGRVSESLSLKIFSCNNRRLKRICHTVPRGTVSTEGIVRRSPNVSFETGIGSFSRRRLTC